ncbi:3,4-dihydroxy-2-butanone-4-phosphate synthase [Prauserella cavernicola]|uniref:3,4-dihydroxy-2-butanone-4-phosphate synthase n=1 Tax=Prauserella cavernicola TaxID=2800127 RepID=A0A934V8J1_9PSEU|nr:3,4-dihydroxy-2-butanone-4-phosphate synthase [Prauserella cavernicola]MBK1787813.1 3,4-dihydroxy-2-butanone-4-phosphate synthase [Prauserella cavernicola]
MNAVPTALRALADGRAVVVSDADGTGFVVFAAATASPGLLAFTVRHGSGFVRVALTGAACDRVRLPAMWPGGDRQRVTVDLRAEGTGISATDRANTIAALASDESDVDDFTRPGHVVPVLAHAGGVLCVPAVPEAAADLARLAGLPAAGALCEIVSVERPVELARGEEVGRFAAAHGLVHLDVDAVVRHRLATEAPLRRTTVVSRPTGHGEWEVVRFDDRLDERYDAAEPGSRWPSPVSSTAS